MKESPQESITLYQEIQQLRTKTLQQEVVNEQLKMTVEQQ